MLTTVKGCLSLAIVYVLVFIQKSTFFVQGSWSPQNAFRSVAFVNGLFSNSKLGATLLNTKTPIYPITTRAIPEDKEDIKNDANPQALIRQHQLSPPHAWVPIAGALELDPERPTPIKFLGKKYVVWKHNVEGWKIFDDLCPHRLAPLSEGRIDEVTGNIQCSYHGWQFNGKGNCACIPQAHNQDAALQSQRSSVPSYPVVVEKNIIWFWPSANTEPSPSAPTPQELMSHIPSVSGTYTRDLPYSYDILLENLVDPAHIPFAHHKLQGSRADALPINMTVLDEGDWGFSASFQDRSGKMLRNGHQEFKAPYTLSYIATRTPDFSIMSKKEQKKAMKNAMKSPPRNFTLNAFCTPTEPGWSRVILPSPRIGGPIPTWLVHILSSRFLDSDLAFLYFQELALVSPDKANLSPEKAFYMPSESDQSIAAFHRWFQSLGWGKAMSQDYSESELPRKQLFDRYQQHVAQCVECQKGLRHIKKTRRITTALCLIGFIWQKSVLVRTAMVVSVIVALACKKLEDYFHARDYLHYKIK
mmetsp:Transcript_11799/g.15408  ORF Transcript_11799/g.15408 Transcript_11799/m.15408 type:complete len:530 (+) Transcript_11799:62-1651(+)